MIQIIIILRILKAKNKQLILLATLQKAINRCREVIFMSTDVAMKKGWVKLEYNATMDQKSSTLNKL